jgi:hypothetical protein
VTQQCAQVHELLLTALTSCVSTWNDDTSCMGAIFLRFAPYFKLYTEYCANYNSFITKINAKMAKPDSSFAVLVKATADKLRLDNVRNDLPSLLIMPVQVCHTCVYIADSV